MSFTVIECEQRSAAWYTARAGLQTASEAQTMLSRPKRGTLETAGRAELRVRLAVEMLTGAPVADAEDAFDSPWMQRGRQLEADAVRAYEAVTGAWVSRVGFLKHDTLPIGCSPDGILGDFEGGLELKCPKHNTHFAYLSRRGTVPPEYVAQITHSLFVTDLPYWDFVSYHPAFPGAARLYCVRVFREDVDLTSYELALRLFLDEVELTVAELRTWSAPEESHAESERSWSRLEEASGERPDLSERVAEP